MDSIKIEGLSFTYSGQEYPALRDLSLTVRQGEFVTICGASGSGKSTLLRQLKPILTPWGKQRGRILFEGRPIGELPQREQSEKIGFVFQNPENQIVTDKVWHELAFGLESLGYSTAEIRIRTAETASFFGIQNWFHKDVSELSGGQKQLLNLAAVMVMQPSLLILDEPVSQLDPISGQEFLENVAKLNRELGTTVLLAEHRLEEAFAVSDRVVVMEKGTIAASGTPKAVGMQLKEKKHPMCWAMPAAMQIYGGVENPSECPVTVREGRVWLQNLCEERGISAAADEFREKITAVPDSPAVELKNLWYRYEKNGPDVVRGLSLTVEKGECFAVVGGNGTGKTTALSLIGGLYSPRRGSLRKKGKTAMLPQDPRTVFVKETVREELGEDAEWVISFCEVGHLLSRHPYDLSGGEQQRVALAKVLLKRPEILLLDEPTKGMDGFFKRRFGKMLAKLKERGMTIIMVSHDIEFCAEFSDRCGMFFDGGMMGVETPRRFFAGKRFYTTAANRISRDYFPEAILPRDVIDRLGGNRQPMDVLDIPENWESEDPGDPDEGGAAVPKNGEKKKSGKFRGSARRIGGIFFGALFVVSAILLKNQFRGAGIYLWQLVQILLLALCLGCLLPKASRGKRMGEEPLEKEKRPPLSGRAKAAMAAVLLLIPATIFLGMNFFGERKYYFIAMLVLFEAFLPFVLMFENRKPQSRELVVIAVLCGIGVVGRAAFFMVPQFKPVAALVILAAVCFGGETGFLVGAVTAFVTNFFFGQGPWTPWQMFAFGAIGLVAGVMSQKGLLPKRRGVLCIFGAAAVLLIYGGMMNPASVLMWQSEFSIHMILTAYVMGLPFDLIHGAATVFFLWFAGLPLLEKLERMKTKYGILR